jgi:hypothetical protein
VDPAKVAGLLAGLAEHAQDFAVEAEFVDAAGESVGCEKELIGRRRDADSPGSAGSHGASVLRRARADRWASIAWRGDIDRDLAEKFSVGVKDLDAAIAAVSDVDVVVRVDADVVRRIKLAGLIARLTPGLEPDAVLVSFGHARIHVAIADVSVTSGIPSHVGDLAEHAIDRRKRWLGMFERAGALIRGFLLASENHDDSALWVELNDHVGAFVGHPDVVFAINANGMREGPGVEIVADLAKKVSVGREFEELGSGCSVGRAGGVAAGEDEDVAFGVDRHTDGFAEVKVGGELEKIRDGTIGDFWNGWLLSEKRGSEEEENCSDGESHGLPPSQRMCERRGRLYTCGWEDAKNGDGFANERTALAGFFSGDLGAFLARFGEPDSNRLLAAFYATALAGAQGPALSWRMALATVLLAPLLYLRRDADFLAAIVSSCPLELA